MLLQEWKDQRLCVCWQGLRIFFYCIPVHMTCVFYFVPLFVFMLKMPPHLSFPNPDTHSLDKNQKASFSINLLPSKNFKKLLAKYHNQSNKSVHYNQIVDLTNNQEEVAATTGGPIKKTAAFKQLEYIKYHINFSQLSISISCFYIAFLFSDSNDV